MDANAFADLPIVGGVGVGPVRLGMTLAELEAILGPAAAPAQLAEMYYPQWAMLGLQATISAMTGRVIALSLFADDPESPNLGPARGRTDRGVAFGADAAAIEQAYGAPKRAQHGRERLDVWTRLGYEGLVFRLVGKLPEGAKLVSIAVEESRVVVESARPRHTELEHAIHANLADAQAYLVYADWLQQQGDRLGARIVEHVRAEPDDADFVREHERGWLGSLAEYEDMLAQRAWRHGFLRKVRVANSFDRSPDHDGEKEAFPVEDVLAMVLDGDVGRFLEELVIGIVSYEDNSYDGCAAVIGARPRPSLRRLFLGDFKRDETELNWVHLGDASPCYAALPNLRSMTLRSGGMTLGDLDLPELRELVILTGGLNKAAIAAIAAARWPKLEKLSLQIGSQRYGSDVIAEDLRPILEGAGVPPTLRHLGLANFDDTDALVPMLARSKILPQLRELDLSLGTLGPDGAAELVAARAAFAHLEKLDLSESWLSPEAVQRVREAFPSAIVDSQHRDTRAASTRYIAAGE